METASGPRTQSVPALERGLLILEHLAQSRRGVTLSQLTSRLQLPRSTGHALLLTYQRCGYVQRDSETGRYRLGSRLHTLANMALAGHSLRTHCSSYLHRLMQETGATVHLAVMEDGEVILIDRAEPNGNARLATWVGKRMGLHCTAVGKAIIAHLPPALLDELIQRQGLMRYNENTISSARKLRAVCEHIRQLGYAVDDEYKTYNLIFWNFSPNPVTLRMDARGLKESLVAHRRMLDAESPSQDENSRLRTLPDYKLAPGGQPLEVTLGPYGIESWAMEPTDWEKQLLGRR
jgi:DNA-binding IclR family transcriptional regulator